MPVSRKRKFIEICKKKPRHSNIAGKMDTEESKMDSAFYNELEQKVLNSFRSITEKLVTIWNHLGISEEFQCGRAKSLESYVLKSMQDIVESELELFNDIVKRIEKCTTDLNELTIILDVPSITIDDSLALLEKEKYLLTCLDKLVHKKQSRIALFEELKKAEQKFCSILQEPEHEIPLKEGVPSETGLSELKDHVKMLREERELRYRKFSLAKENLTALMEIMEIIPETRFEKDLIYFEEEFLLSAENLITLQKFVEKVKNKKICLEKQKEVLLGKLIKLWDRLNMRDEEKYDFLTNHEKLFPSTMQDIQNEIERLQDILKMNIQSYIEIVCSELKDLWDKCHISEYDRNQFLTSLNTDEYTEEALHAYEAEVHRMNEFFKDTEDILRKVEQWQKLWDEMLKLESKASDPSRFANRGGNLLKEEKERKKLQKQLPQLECDLLKTVEDYEHRTGKFYLFDGKPLQDFIQNQWEKRAEEKENKKITRGQLRVNVAAMQTPVNRRLVHVIPNSAPSKMIMSNAGTKAFCTPSLSSQIIAPKSCRRINAIPKGSPFVASKYRKRNAMTEQNIVVGEKDLLEGTLYSDFEEVVNKPSRSDLRSTTFTKKVLGGKVANIRGRKSAGLANRNLKIGKKAHPKLVIVK